MLLSCATIPISDSFTSIKASGHNDLDPLMHQRNKEKFNRVFGLSRLLHELLAVENSTAQVLKL